MKYTIPQLGKAIAAFILPLLSNMVLDLSQGSVPWPQTGAEWARYVGLSVVTAAGVFLTKSETTPEQITRISEKKPGVVVEGVTAASTAPQIGKAVVAVEAAPPPDTDAEIADRIVDKVLREHGQETS
jgi:hypothetical protein